MPKDVEVSMDVVGNAHTQLDGVGVICKLKLFQEINQEGIDDL